MPGTTSISRASLAGDEAVVTAEASTLQWRGARAGNY